MDRETYTYQSRKYHNIPMSKRAAEEQLVPTTELNEAAELKMSILKSRTELLEHLKIDLEDTERKWYPSWSESDLDDLQKLIDVVKSEQEDSKIRFSESLYNNRRFTPNEMYDFCFDVMNTDAMLAELLLDLETLDGLRKAVH